MAYWQKRLEARIGQVVEVHISYNGLPTSIQGTLAREGDAWLLRAERGVYPSILGMDPSGNPVTRPEVIPSSEYELYVGDIVTMTKRNETREQAMEILNSEGKLSQRGGRVVVPKLFQG